MRYSASAMPMLMAQRWDLHAVGSGSELCLGFSDEDEVLYPPLTYLERVLLLRSK